MPSPERKHQIRSEYFEVHDPVPPFHIVNLGGKLFQPLIDIENASPSPHQPPRSQIIDKHDSIKTARSLEASGLVYFENSRAAAPEYPTVLATPDQSNL